MDDKTGASTVVRNRKNTKNKPVENVETVIKNGTNSAPKTDPVAPNESLFGQFTCQLDIVSLVLFVCGLLTRLYRLDQPRSIVFDELHYGKYISLYMKNTFFFDNHPPLGKQLIALAAYMANYNGTFKFDKIGTTYSETVPIAALRAVPALFGALIIPTAYHLLLETGVRQKTAILGALLIVFENALLTQSRFILMESLLLFFTLFGLVALQKFRTARDYTFRWFVWLTLTAGGLICAVCVKYTGFYVWCLGVALMGADFWRLLRTPLTDGALFVRFLIQSSVMTLVALLLYSSVYYVHLRWLYKAGPHDTIMTSAFQASLEGGLASITRGQPLLVAHGSQITLRHTHGRTCWLHSHNALYPVRYSDRRGSSHQQQVTCYSFKDVNNWWLVKKPNKTDLTVEQPIDVIRHGDVIQLVHGITSRALNSHDVAAPLTPQCQEVSCYIDYNISMAPQMLWRVEITNVEGATDQWHTIKSLVRLVHVDSGAALRFTGRQLPDWAYHQHEIAADRHPQQDDTIWNVEEHRYTKSDDQKERERDLLQAEMIPTTVTHLSFWDKVTELHYKMFMTSDTSDSTNVQNHMYSSEPLEWPLLTRGIAYWVGMDSNAQVHLLGNLLVWISGTTALAVYAILLAYYMVRRRRICLDVPDVVWRQFCRIGEVFFAGYLIHYVPYFFMERTLFLHHYLPALTFKLLLLTALIDYVYYYCSIGRRVLRVAGTIWFLGILYNFYRFSVFSYGTTDLLTTDVLALRWRDTWDFIIQTKT